MLTGELKPLTDMAHSTADEEYIRKVVGQRREPVRPLQQAYELSQRLRARGVNDKQDDERIRKVVGQPESGRR